MTFMIPKNGDGRRQGMQSLENLNDVRRLMRLIVAVSQLVELSRWPAIAAGYVCQGRRLVLNTLHSSWPPSEIWIAHSNRCFQARSTHR